MSIRKGYLVAWRLPHLLRLFKGMIPEDEAPFPNQFSRTLVQELLVGKRISSIFRLRFPNFDKLLWYIVFLIILFKVSSKASIMQRKSGKKKSLKMSRKSEHQKKIERKKKLTIPIKI